MRNGYIVSIVVTIQLMIVYNKCFSRIFVLFYVPLLMYLEWVPFRGIGGDTANSTLLPARAGECGRNSGQSGLQTGTGRGGQSSDRQGSQSRHVAKVNARGQRPIVAQGFRGISRHATSC